MAGSLQEIEAAVTELDGVAVRYGRVRHGRARALAEIDTRTSAVGKLVVAGDEVGVEVCFDDVPDLQTLVSGRVDVDVDVALGVDDGGNPF